MNEMKERRLRTLEALLVEFAKFSEGQGQPQERFIQQTLAYVQASLASAQRKIVDTAYPDSKAPGFKRELILFEVLSERGTEDSGLADVVDETITGDASGQHTYLVTETVPASLMAGLLMEQSSDPSFLLGEPAEKED
jgi:hypothetical protein